MSTEIENNDNTNDEVVENNEAPSSFDNLNSPDENEGVTLAEDKVKVNELLFGNESDKEVESEDNEDADADEVNATSDETPKEEAPKEDKGITEAQLEAIKTAVSQAAPKQPEAETPTAPSRQYTKEELEQALGRVVVTPEMASGLLGLEASPQQVAQLQALLDGVSGYSMRAAAAYAKSREDTIRQDYDKRLAAYEQTMQPVTESMKQQQAAVMVKAFYAKYPELDKYQAVVNNVVSGLRGTITEKDTFDSATEKVATETKKLLTSLGINLTESTKEKANHSAPAKSSVPKMQQLNEGGRSQSKTNKPTKQSRLNSLLFN